MKDKTEISFDDFDEQVNPRPLECDFDRIVEKSLSRREVLKGILAVGSVATLGSFALTDDVVASSSRFAFEQIPTNTLDDITVPQGYVSQIVARWGDPLWSGVPEFDHATRGTAKDQEKTFGDNIDGMDVFSHEGHTLLVVNNEYTNRDIIWGNREEGKAETDDDVLKGKMAHGLTVVEIAQDGTEWSIVKDSPFNRRVTPDTEMELTGPAKGHELMKTADDPTGTKSLGTWNNCGNGITPVSYTHLTLPTIYSV